MPAGERPSDREDDDHRQDRQHDEEPSRGLPVIQLVGVRARRTAVGEQEGEPSPDRHEAPCHDDRQPGRNPSCSEQDSCQLHRDPSVSVISVHTWP